MLSYVLTGFICFCAGSVCGVFITALLAASKDEDERWK